MIKLKDLKIDARATVGSQLLLIKDAPTFTYDDNGIPTQTIDGTRYTVACPACDMQTLSVKVPGPQTLSRGDRAIMPVIFDGLDLYIYFRDGKPMVGGRAKAIRAADDKH